MKKLHSEATDLLFQAILNLETVEECYDFFEDLCTIKEIREMSQRMSVAKLLDQGMNYQEISELTTVSTATISRVKRSLVYGSNGYQCALERLKAAEEAK